MKKLITIVLVFGVVLTACGGGGQKAEMPVAGVISTEESPAPTKAAAPTSVATATSVSTVAPAVTPEPAPISQPSPKYGPPPIIDLTVVYPDGESITVPIYCPVPLEFCHTGVHIYDFDGNYLGLGFNLPEGTPIFAVGTSQLRLTSTGCYDWGDGNWTSDFGYVLYKILPATNFRYDHSGFSTVFPNPEIINGKCVIPEPVSPVQVTGGQEVGRVITNNVDVGWDTNGKMLPFNFIFAAERRYGDGTSTPCRIYLGSQPTVESPTPKPILVPTIAVLLSDGSEIPIACPVPEEFCRTATELFRDDGSFYGLGFTLPAETPILAVADGKVEGGSNGWWSPANDPDKRYYPIAYSLTAGSLNFHYSYVNDSPVDPSSAEVEARQELGRVTRYGFDKCVNRCWAKFDPFNFIFRAEDCSTGGWSCPVLLIRVN